MQIYQVGGSVRDQLLGLTPVDRDYVVVGASVDEMMAQGYVQVGKDFPVFLHPQTKCEYALARTERKSGKGYAGFVVHASPEVTLEEDLLRRDLTINAMAMDANGRLIDPYGGANDLVAKMLRHVSPAFAEDPLRVLRLARFAAKFAEFKVAPETTLLCKALVDSGEVAALVPERVWQEIARGLMEGVPSHMLQILEICGAWRVLFPEIPLTTTHKARLDLAATQNLPLAVRFALLCAGTPPNKLSTLCERIRVPRDCRELAEVISHGIKDFLRIESMSAAERHDLLARADALRRPERFNDALAVLSLCGQEDSARSLAEKTLAAMRTVDAAKIAQSAAANEMREAVRSARINAITAQISANAAQPLK